MTEPEPTGPPRASTATVPSTRAGVLAGCVATVSSAALVIAAVFGFQSRGIVAGQARGSVIDIPGDVRAYGPAVESPPPAPGQPSSPRGSSSPVVPDSPQPSATPSPTVSGVTVPRDGDSPRPTSPTSAPTSAPGRPTPSAPPTTGRPTPRPSTSSPTNTPPPVFAVPFTEQQRAFAVDVVTSNVTHQVKRALRFTETVTPAEQIVENLQAKLPVEVNDSLNEAAVASYDAGKVVAAQGSPEPVVRAVAQTTYFETFTVALETNVMDVVIDEVGDVEGYGKAPTVQQAVSAVLPNTAFKVSETTVETVTDAVTEFLEPNEPTAPPVPSPPPTPSAVPLTVPEPTRASSYFPAYGSFPTYGSGQPHLKP
ncbi:MAG: hypothetical protein ACRCTR_08475 [Actinomycetota bacterium]